MVFLCPFKLFPTNLLICFSFVAMLEIIEGHIIFTPTMISTTKSIWRESLLTKGPYDQMTTGWQNLWRCFSLTNRWFSIRLTLICMWIYTSFSFLSRVAEGLNESWETKYWGIKCISQYIVSSAHCWKQNIYTLVYHQFFSKSKQLFIVLKHFHFESFWFLHHYHDHNSKWSHICSNLSGRQY